MSLGMDGTPSIGVTADITPENYDGEVVGPLLIGNGHGDHPTHDLSGELSTPNALLPQPDFNSLTSPEKTRFKMDVHTRAYVPEALTGINHLPSILVPSEPLRVQNYRTYIATFAGNAFLSPQPPYTIDYQKASRHVAALEHLQSSTYRGHFQACLLEEHAAQVTAVCSYDMFGVHLEVFDPAEMLFTLKVPGLREGVPEVNLGDVVMLRQLILNPHTQLPIRYNTHPPNSIENYTSGFTGLQHAAVVYSISKIDERLLLKIEGLRTQMLHFNVSFQYPERISHALQRALISVSSVLEIAHDFLKGHHDTAQPTSTLINRNRTTELVKGGDWLRRMLLPKVEDGILGDNLLPNPVVQLKWLDTEVNYEQKV